MAIALWACANLDGLAGGGAGPAAPVDAGAETSISVPGNDAGDGGTSTFGTVTVTPATLAFPDGKCGTAQTATVRMVNDGNEATPYTLTLLDATFSLEGADAKGVLTGTLAAHGSALATVRAAAAAPGTATADIQALIGTNANTLSVNLLTRGATLTFTPATLDFGQIRRNIDSEPLPVTLRNDGTDPVTVTSFSGAAGFITPTTLTVGAQSSVTAQFLMQAGPAGAPIDANLRPQIAGEVCSEVPQLELKGTRVSTDVTVTPAAVDLGNVNCGATSGNAAVTISNFSPGSAHYELSLPASSRFVIQGLTSGDVAKAPDSNHPTTLSIPIGLANVGTTPGDATDTLKVTITGGTIVESQVALHAHVIGAVVVLDQTSITLPRHDDVKVGIKNTGNVKVCVKYAVQNDPSRDLTLENDKGDTLDVNDLTQELYVSHDGFGNPDASVTITAASCGAVAEATPPICGTLPTLAVKAVHF